VAEKYLKTVHQVEIVAFVSSVGDVDISKADIIRLSDTVQRTQVDQNAIRCPLPELAEKMSNVIYYYSLLNHYINLSIIVVTIDPTYLISLGS
jgi:chorismate synthase